MKSTKLAVTIAAILFAGCSPAAAQPGSPGPKQAHPDRPLRVSDFSMFPLHDGVNRIDNFTRDGREGMVVLGWRDNGNAHGFDVFMVLAPTSVGGTDYNVVTFNADGQGSVSATSISDDPHTGEDVVRSVRFGRARLAGRLETIAFVAERQIAGSYPDAARARMQLFVLRNRGDDPVGSVDFFESAADFMTTRLYCDADAALHSELGVPLPDGYGAADPADGCS
jgi:hypothetical protein